MERLLIVNADDFGQSEGTTSGILRAHRNGIVTSASVMVRWPAAPDAVARAGELDLGLHIDLGEWAFRDKQWIPLYERAPLDDIRAVESEVHDQLKEFRRLTGTDPSHIDSHQHVHLHEPVRSVAKRLANELAVPLRRCTPNIHYCGSFYGQSGIGEPCPDAISVSALMNVLRNLPAGITELACHPGEDEELESSYASERRLEIDVLSHPQIRETIRKHGIRLCRFTDVSLGA